MEATGREALGPPKDLGATCVAGQGPPCSDVTVITGTAQNESSLLDAIAAARAYGVGPFRLPSLRSPLGDAPGEGRGLPAPSSLLSWLTPLLAALESADAERIKTRIEQLDDEELARGPIELGPVRLAASAEWHGHLAIRLWPSRAGEELCLEGCVLDVSAWQTAVDTVPRLERELHHRTKNGLQLASSLLAIEWDQTEEEQCREVLQQVRTRMICISRVHEQLFARGSLTHVDFGVVARNLAEELRNMIAPRLPLHVDGEAVELDYERAIPAAIICSELFTACLHHLREREGAHLAVLVRGGTEEMQVIVDQPSAVHPLEEGTDARRSILSAMVRQLRGTLTSLCDDEGQRTTVLRVPLQTSTSAATRF